VAKGGEGKGAMTNRSRHGRGYTLILLYRPEAKQDFDAIADRIEMRAPDIVIVTGSIGADQTLPPNVWARPTLTVALGRFRLEIKRGLIYRCRRVLKDEQFENYRAAGIDTPLTARFRLGMELDPALWGDHVILKPMHINSHGEGIHLVRTGRASALTLEDFSQDHPIRRDDYLVQEFIDTGEYPCHYRVVSFLGEALSFRRNFVTTKRPPLDADDDSLMRGNIVSNFEADDGGTELSNDAEILDFARRMHAAQPGIPLQGLDILRHTRTGKLYALESNCGGNTWGFSSEMGEKARRFFGGTGPMIEQFGAWDIAADALIKRTRAEAR
jgi:hypothetical protein